ncbi:sugar ABC transporter ATP-binding protein [Sphaerisporangium sp. NPDC088356]|uniref:sugar ABC transporter ATP-binding protein n=1 Tax=Sphaerisporangium sp. NPDC088356 TaxID=3154871 RepID=UPI0034235CD9
MLQVSNAMKRYGGVQALGGVTLDVAEGTVHALLGHNGAGKSTLIRALSGATTLDEGRIELDGDVLQLESPRSAIAAGIATIHQNLSLVGALTVAENIFLGNEKRRGLFVRRGQQRDQAAETLSQLGLDGIHNRRVATLSMGTQQLVEIAKALERHSPRVLILDEPTAALTHGEVEKLFEQVAALRARGLHIIYVTHRLAEIEQIADHVTVLKNGEVVLSQPTANLHRDDVFRAIAPGRSTSGGAGVAHAVNGPAEAHSAAASQAGARPSGGLEVRRLDGHGLRGVDLQVKAGEIVGLYGPLGSGGSAILDILAGARRNWAGEIALGGNVYAPRSPSDALRKGVALVPSDRRSRALFAGMTMSENVLIAKAQRVSRAWLRSTRRERQAFDRVAADVNLIPRDPRAVAGLLSGGNQQKCVLARWLVISEELRVLLLDEPTQGIDVGARAEIYSLLRRAARDEGMAVLVNSSDVEEVVAIADRAYVIVDGAITGTVAAADLTEAQLLNLANQ